MKRKISILMILVFSVALAGCASTNIDAKRAGLGIMDWYTQTLNQHEAAVKAFKPKSEFNTIAEWEASAGELEFLNKEADILNRVKPLIKTYVRYVDSGKPVPADILESIQAIQAEYLELTGGK